MYGRLVVVFLGAALLLGGCSSRNHRHAPAKIAPSDLAARTNSKYMPQRPDNIDPSYDPFFDRSRHPVQPRRMRGFPHADTTIWTDRSRDGFTYARIYANRDGSPYQLDSGDVVRIDVFEQSNLSRLYRIDGGGNISMPLIGSVHARGLTTQALEQEVAGKLRQSYIRDPKVTVEISTHRPFYILGEVRNAGQYPFVVGMTIETAVAIAGGYSPRANEKKALVIRKLGGKLVRTYVPNNYEIKPGDTLKIVERLF